MSKRAALKPAKPAPATKLTLLDWQRTPALVAAGQRLLSDPAFRLALAIIRNDSPANTALPMGTDIAARACHQAMIEGFHLCLNSIEALDTPVADDGPSIAPDFSPEAAEEAWRSAFPDMTDESDDANVKP